MADRIAASTAQMWSTNVPEPLALAYFPVPPPSL